MDSACWSTLPGHCSKRPTRTSKTSNATYRFLVHVVLMSVLACPWFSLIPALLIRNLLDRGGGSSYASYWWPWKIQRPLAETCHSAVLRDGKTLPKGNSSNDGLRRCVVPENGISTSTAGFLAAVCFIVQLWLFEFAISSWRIWRYYCKLYTSIHALVKVSRFRRLAQRSKGAQQRNTKALKERLRDVCESWKWLGLYIYIYMYVWFILSIHITRNAICMHLYKYIYIYIFTFD